MKAWCIAKVCHTQLLPESGSCSSLSLFDFFLPFLDFLVPEEEEEERVTNQRRIVCMYAKVYKIMEAANLQQEQQQLSEAGRSQDEHWHLWTETQWEDQVRRESAAF